MGVFGDRGSFKAYSPLTNLGLGEQLCILNEFIPGTWWVLNSRLSEHRLIVEQGIGQAIQRNRGGNLTGSARGSQRGCQELVLPSNGIHVGLIKGEKGTCGL